MITEQDIQKFHDLMSGKISNRKLRKIKRKGHIKYRDTYIFMEEVLRAILANPYYGITKLSLVCQISNKDMNNWMDYMKDRGLLENDRLVTMKGMRFLKIMENLKTICPEKILYGWEYEGGRKEERGL